MGPFRVLVGGAWGAGGYVRHKLKHLPTKFGPRGYYKGNNARKLGKALKNSGYTIDWANRIPEFVVPDLEGCELRPYVSRRTPKTKVAAPEVP
mmetsp:Transcript_48256/g.118174  ORF Transcript_48256/g.118174 Transcript_48256/m.118174 type:complete len:93 (+) Transcript_48256:82-360(+)